MLESSIYNLLSHDSNITDLVDTRIYPLLAEEKAAEPYIVFQIISAQKDHTLTGGIDLQNAKFQVSVWGKKYQDAITLKNEVIECLDNFAGSIIATGITIQIIHFKDERDLIDFNAGQDINKRFGKGLDFEIWFN